MTKEILTALRNIEDKIMREPSAFTWTPEMCAIWPKDMRPTMSGLLAIWSAMRDAAVYDLPSQPLAEPVADAKGWVHRYDGDKRPEFIVDLVCKDGYRDRGEIPNDWWDTNSPDRVVKWRPAK